MARTKTRGANVPVPQTRDEAAAMVREIGELARERARIEADMNDRLAELKQSATSHAQPLADEIAAKTEGLKIWAEANRAELTKDGKTKTADLGTGLLKWRTLPPSVRLTKVADILARLKGMNLRRFIRVKEEVNKDALLEEPDIAATVPGIRIGSAGEDFVVEPFETELPADTTASGRG